MIKTYDKYKESDDIWLGHIPEHWTISSLKHFVEIISGYAFKSEDYSDDEGVPIIRIGDISNSVDVHNAKKANPKNLEELERFIIKRGDLLLAMTGATIGKNCMYNTDDISYVNQRVGLLRGKGSLTQAFLKYYIDTPLFREFISLTCSGSAQENISASQVGGLQFPLPTLEEQTKIAQYLDHQTAIIDQLIQQKEKLIELLKEKRQAVINEAITKGPNPNAKMKDSGIEWLGEVPVDWVIRRIGFISDLLTGFPWKSELFHYENGIKIVRGENVSEGFLRWGERTRFWKQEVEDNSKYFLNEKDIVIAMDGSKVGKNYVLINSTDLPLLLHQRMCRVRVNSGISPKFILYYVGSDMFRYYIDISKTDPMIPHITQKNIFDFQLAVPSIHIQEYIVDYLDTQTLTIDSLILNEEYQIEKIKEYRQSIISEAVTGKIDVREWRPNKQQVT